MKIIKDEIATIKRKRRLIVELDHAEVLMAFRDNDYYKMGDQLDDVLIGSIITASQKVTWCSIAQRWVE